MKYKRKEYAALADALNEVATARACIAQNRGQGKEEAREGYECAVGETLVPALAAALEVASGDMDARDVERMANAVQQLLIRSGVAVYKADA